MAKKTAKKSVRKTTGKSAKKSVRKTTGKSAKKVSITAYGKRTMIKPNGDARYIRRDPLGRIRESDDVGRSLKQDRRTKSKKKARSGHGDRGDR
jgi:hypothetical protein